jgi:2-polyprenyl-3-methyl-5-hydroxy-6-metoxy-1,4-benzoquinol methylase
MSSQTMYEAFGELADKSDDPLILSGRNAFNAPTVAAMVSDIRNKLDLQPEDRLIEIGCATGLLLVPLSKHVQSAVGQDHPNLLAKMEKPHDDANITLLGGLWPDVQPDGMFNKILAYSVLSVVPTPEEARSFIDACVERLEPNGICLIGDLPNPDRQKRFMESEDGQKIAETYVAARNQDRESGLKDDYEARDRIWERHEFPDGFITDAFLLDVIGSLRQRGLDAYLVPQPSELPYSFSREDLLIWKRN